MQYISYHIQTISQQYNGASPLANWLVKYFKANPKLGSRDRKAISEALYIYFRLKNRLDSDLDIFKILSIADNFIPIKSVFLQKFIEQLPQNGKEEITLSYSQKPYPSLSDGITRKDWEDAFLTQRNVFLRLTKISYLEKIKHAEIPFSVMEDNIIAVPNGTPIQQILNEQEYIIQDYASSKTISRLINYLKTNNLGKKQLSVWDVCAGAGGKSIYLKEQLPDLKILSTDIRQTILLNLKKRAEMYGIKGIHTEVMDASDHTLLHHKMQSRSFDVIIADVPCSGSGTWQRTPEQWTFSDSNTLNNFPNLQVKIANNAIKYLKPNGIFLYITCSVFRQENEDVVAQILAKNTNIKLIDSGLINELDQKADCLYCALFTN